ncbi:HIT domain-containing protein [Enterovibrio nigricans]|uniref:Diadenosine tetraphosphate (Ap4A) hydrolase n=1 Tax=Enterovibrio nigricans DSM 22720 TaxID=1121868 RepID=A0A1T4UAI1_9GAMM|nr:HIT family protein [Enterovibrio nigricans]PKF51565.1 HIT domain-containing protein [Enterovibrio nigricans]SKA49724.1 Diadenosine tetraphosphate (Ap4A) hydrolase [Enterovibrio nigricans DSM 22720]
MAFSLHPRLDADTTWLGDLPLCRVLLSKEDIGPWLILVPKIEGITEIHHLSEEEQVLFITESSAVASLLEQKSHPDKINIGALGNMVSQLHIHHIARFQDDVAWPGPIWGNTKGIIREEAVQNDVAATWKQHLSSIEHFVLA